MACPKHQDLTDTLTSLAQQLPSMDVDLILTNRLIRQVANRTTICFNDCLKKHDLNETLWYALLAIYARSGRNMLPSQLSNILNLTRTSATRLSDELVHRGWVVRQAHAKDRRKITLHLTEAGIHKVESVSPQTNALRQQLWASISPEQQQQLRAVLNTLLCQLDILQQVHEP